MEALGILMMIGLGVWVTMQIQKHRQPPIQRKPRHNPKHLPMILPR